MRKKRVSQSDAYHYAVGQGADSHAADEFSAWAHEWFDNLNDAWAIYDYSLRCRCAPCQAGQPENCYKCPSCNKIHGVITGCNPPTPNWTIGLRPL